MPRRPGMSEGQMIDEQMPLTEKDIQDEITKVLEDAKIVAKDFPEITINEKDKKVTLVVNYEEAQGEEEENQLERAMGDVCKSIEEKGYTVEYSHGGFDKKGYGYETEVKDE